MELPSERFTLSRGGMPDAEAAPLAVMLTRCAKVWPAFAVCGYPSDKRRAVSLERSVGPVALILHLEQITLEIEPGFDPAGERNRQAGNSVEERKIETAFVSAVDQSSSAVRPRWVRRA